MGFSLKTVLLAACAGLHHRRGRHPAGHLRRRAVGHLRHLPAGDGGVAHPREGCAATFSLLLPVGVGVILGFPVRRRADPCCSTARKKLATCLFIGLILGTLSRAWGRGGRAGRGRGAYLSCAASFFALSAVLLYAQYGAFYTMRPGFLGFLLRPALRA